MSLDEAIQHLEEILVDENHEWSCETCRAEHRQLLEWLKELRERRSVAREIENARDNEEAVRKFMADIQYALVELGAPQADIDRVHPIMARNAIKRGATPMDIAMALMM